MIKVTGTFQADAYKAYVQKHANSLGVEGTIQNDNDDIAIYACGLSDKLDRLIDLLYKGTEKSKLKNIVEEPFISEKDFRGVFRIIG
jgi:acylphosphatase